MPAAETTAHHGTHHTSLPLVSGLCLAVGGSDDGYTAASEYAKRSGGEYVFEVSIDLAGLTVREVEVDAAALLRTGDDYPGDSARERAALIAEGVDAIAFADECCGRAHRTLRLISDRALAAVTLTGTFDPA